MSRGGFPISIELEEGSVVRAHTAQSSRTRLASIFVSALPTAAKTARLRQAKEEAEREAAAYRAQREADYQKKKTGVSPFS